VTELVVDTNVLFSALYDPESPPGRIVEFALEGTVELYAPETVRAELRDVLVRKLDYTKDEWSETKQALPVEWIDEPVYEGEIEEARSAIADEDDAPVVAASLVTGAPVVSGDGDFHPLEEAAVETYRPRASVDEIDGG